MEGADQYEETIKKVFSSVPKKPSSPHSALFLFVHAFLQHEGFKVVGFGEEGNLLEQKTLTEDWDKSEDAWAFRYRHSQSSMTFLVKGIRLGDQLMLHALAVEQNEPLSLNLKVPNFVTPASLRLDSPLEICHALAQLRELLKREITSKLVPSVEDLRKETGSAAQPQPAAPSAQPLMPRNPLRDDPLRDTRHDPLRIDQPRYPRGVGRDDLEPFFPGGPSGHMGGGPGFRPAFGGGGGMGGPPGFGGGGGLVGPRHPGFGPYVNDPFARPPSNGRRGMPPPGGRFDPYGPPGFNQPWPDSDHLPPPGPGNTGGGWGDMFG
eukprot:TRINITY_DN1205_c0_g1_i1.p1 TRINITY_DN1205_c0_g1~~TRINITY_DN1205_c0_g1_i1.p1  ORF type:complete len:321 (+),score=63.89 TRINITY_DN1205_c0_g1_i1:192-1154(+)